MAKRTAQFLAVLLLISVEVYGSGTAYLEWKQDFYYIDGIPLPPEDILKFTIHYGVNPREYIYQESVPGNQFNLNLTVPTSGIWYIAATATDIYSQTSDYSNEVRRDVKALRRPSPMKLMVTIVK
jgi:hypothetical protein